MSLMNLEARVSRLSSVLEEEHVVSQLGQVLSEDSALDRVLTRVESQCSRIFSTRQSSRKEDILELSSASTGTGSSSTRDVELDSNDPKAVVKKYWKASFAHPGKRKLVQTASKLRQQALLGEELRKLEKETVIWRGEFSRPAGNVVQ